MECSFPSWTDEMCLFILLFDYIWKSQMDLDYFWTQYLWYYLQSTAYIFQHIIQWIGIISECNVCNSYLTINESLKAHVFSAHEGKEPFQCNMCGASFTKNWQLAWECIKLLFCENVWSISTFERFWAFMHCSNMFFQVIFREQIY